MTPNRLTYITKSVSLTVGVLLYIKIKRTELLFCPLYINIVKIFTTN